VLSELIFGVRALEPPPGHRCLIDFAARCGECGQPMWAHIWPRLDATVEGCARFVAMPEIARTER